MNTLIKKFEEFSQNDKTLYYLFCTLVIIYGLGEIAFYFGKSLNNNL